MQSDENIYCGDVVMDSFNKASADENTIIDQTYRCKYVWIIIMKVYNIIKNTY